MPRKDIYTYRPYYIDREKLYDMYSTIMGGYWRQEDIVETKHINDQRSHKRAGSIGFTISFAPKATDDHMDFGGSSERLFSRQSESGLQRTTKRELSPCVLLNWMLKRLDEEKCLTKAGLRHHFKPTSENIGDPIVIKGIVCMNTRKIVSGAKNETRKRKRIFDRMLSYIADSQKDKELVKKRFCIVSREEFPLDSYLRQIWIVLQELMYDMRNLEHLYENDEITRIAEIVKELSDMYSHGILGEYEDLWAMNRISKVSRLLYDRKFSCLVDDAIRRLDDFENRWGGDVDAGIMYIKDKFSSLRRCLHEVTKLFEEAQKLNTNPAVNDGGKQIQIKHTYPYVFNLDEQMLYRANLEDILNYTPVHCLGLIKSTGVHMCEIEVVAIYQ